MKVIFSEKCLEYRQPLHPESPRRVQLAYEYLKDKDFGFIEPAPCKEDDILTVHTKELLDLVKSGTFSDPDTPNIKDIFEYAKLSAGAAMQAANIALDDEPCLSLMRPPGHHATKNNLGGFCYFNNIAIAVKSILGKIKKVAILDIDAHHGNGTQDIFWSQDKVLYVSLHQVPLYPGTGLISELNCLNFPVKSGVMEEEYLEILKDSVERIKDFSPDVLAVSLGFDTYIDDPLAGINLTKESYFKIAKVISKLNKRAFFILEGGYSKDLGPCIESFMKGCSSGQ